MLCLQLFILLTSEINECPSNLHIVYLYFNDGSYATPCTAVIDVSMVYVVSVLLHSCVQEVLCKWKVCETRQVFMLHRI